MRASSAALATLAALCLCATPAAAADDEVEQLRELVLQLEDRIQQLERPQYGQTRPVASAGRGVQLSGFSSLAWFDGQQDSSFPDDSFQVWDARFFLDAEIARDIRNGERTLIEHASLSFEWNLVRQGFQANDVGDLFVDLRGLGANRWLNLQVGRFQIPVGESYLRYGKGASSNPFISDPVAGPWFWDEGLRLFGSDREGRFGYVASLSDGETSFNGDANGDKQVTLKLFAQPFSWLYLSASALRSGGIGSSSTPAQSAIWFGEGWARAFGSGSTVASFDHGVAVPDGPNELRDVVLIGGDAVLSWPEAARLWLGYGAIGVDSKGPNLYDRDLRYWLAELVVEGALLSRTLDTLYLALRANGVGSYDRDRGYLLDRRYAGTLGYNMRSLEAFSAGLGYRMAPGLDLRVEFTRQQIDLVRGVPAAIEDAADRTDFVGAALGVSF